MPITGVSHHGICVHDLEASLHFYCEVLGFDRVAHMTGIDDPEVGRLLELDDLSMELAFVELDGFRVELIHIRNPPPSGGGKGAFHRVGFTHLSVRVADFDAELDRLRALGVPMLENTIGASAGSNARFAFVLDPDGNRVELFGAIDETERKPWELG
ncbi:MAG: VOC family protein [bacterium]|nr:VOC family protein [bacterium]